MKLEGRFVEGFFLSRLNRFSAQVLVEGFAERCFLPNPGRLQELLVKDAKVVLRRVKVQGRKTAFDLIGVYVSGRVVTIDSRLPNLVVEEAFREKSLKEFAEYVKVQREFRYEGSRFDFCLANDSRKCLVEVKSCTLVEDGVALFPDGTTKRGAKHLQHLAEALLEGFEGCVIFIVQNPTAEIFSPNRAVDPGFMRAFIDAERFGVKMYAYVVDSPLKFPEVKVGRRIPIVV